MNRITLYWRNDSAQAEFNGAWLTVKTKDKNILINREPTNNDWYNPAHSNIMRALHELEKAIEAGINADNWEGQ